MPCLLSSVSYKDSRGDLQRGFYENEVKFSGAISNTCSSKSILNSAVDFAVA